MLTNSFVFPGINKEIETTIWKNNILNWQEFQKQSHVLPIQENKKKQINSYINKSQTALKNNHHHFFKDCIAASEHWRLYKQFPCCYVDIETTGLSRYHNQITTIALFNGKESKVFVQGQNLNDFLDEIKKYKVMVTYNGKTFDLPFMQTKFNTNFDAIHIDLRYPLAKLGYKGGLKNIEKQLGVARQEEVDGRLAVKLWYRYKSGDVASLELLKRYNIEDVENLLPLMKFTFDKLKEKEFLSVIK